MSTLNFQFKQIKFLFVPLEQSFIPTKNSKPYYLPIIVIFGVKSNCASSLVWIVSVVLFTGDTVTVVLIISLNNLLKLEIKELSNKITCPFCVLVVDVVLFTLRVGRRPTWTFPSFLRASSYNFDILRKLKSFENKYEKQSHHNVLHFDSP